jgi:SAM-dependent methyltransferase
MASAVYDRIGTAYADHRRADPRIAAQIEQAVGSARTVLDVGAGAGSYETGDRRYTAVEPSSVMLAQRPTGAAPAVQAVAAHLPFADGAFDAAMAVLTVHHWPDAAAGLAEVRRVTRGAIAVLTWRSDRLAGFWLVAEYLPEAEAHDRTLTDADRISALLPGSTVQTVSVPHDCTDGFMAAYWRRPEAYLDPAKRAAISGIALLDPDAVDRMAERLTADLADGTWHRRHHDLLDLDSFDHGYRLVVAPGN